MPIRIRISLNISLFVVTRKVCRFSLIFDPLKLFKKPVAVPLGTIFILRKDIGVGGPKNGNFPLLNVVKMFLCKWVGG